MQVAATFGILVGVFWLGSAIVLWFFGYAARNHANITVGNMYHADPALDRKAFTQQTKLGRIGSTMLKFWPGPVAIFVASIVAGALTK